MQSMFKELLKLLKLLLLCNDKTFFLSMLEGKKGADIE